VLVGIRLIILRMLIGALAALGPIGSAWASENGQQVYRLGIRGPVAGIRPEPGVYLQSNKFYYEADAGADLQIPDAGRVIAGVKAKAAVEIPIALWMTDLKIAGGNFGLAVGVPFGRLRVKAGSEFSIDDLDLAIGALLEEKQFMVGDPIVNPTIGWNAGNFHWNINGQVNIPIGDYERDRLVNLSYNRWAADLTGAFTWLNRENGREVSAAAGVTFNGENNATNYQTGTESHFEVAVQQWLSKQLSVGLVGYHYQQISGDSGEGAVLGDFKGRVTALGPVIGFSFDLGDTTIFANARWYREFNTRNRLDGDAGYLTFNIPLGGSHNGG